MKSLGFGRFHKRSDQKMSLCAKRWIATENSCSPSWESIHLLLKDGYEWVHLNAGVCSDTFRYQWAQCILAASKTTKPPPPACSAVTYWTFSVLILARYKCCLLHLMRNLFRHTCLKGKSWNQKLPWYKMNECNRMSWPIPILLNKVGISANTQWEHRQFKWLFFSFMFWSNCSCNSIGSTQLFWHFCCMYVS